MKPLTSGRPPPTPRMPKVTITTQIVHRRRRCLAASSKRTSRSFAEKRSFPRTNRLAVIVVLSTYSPPYRILPFLQTLPSQFLAELHRGVLPCPYEGAATSGCSERDSGKRRTEGSERVSVMVALECWGCIENTDGIDKMRLQLPQQLVRECKKGQFILTIPRICCTRGHRERFLLIGRGHFVRAITMASTACAQL